MTENGSERSSEPATPSSENWTVRLGWARAIGLILAFVGTADGIGMILVRNEAGCPNGKEFPEGTTDFTCYAHPFAAQGVAVAAVSLVLAVLIVLAVWIATALLVDRYDQTRVIQGEGSPVASE